MVLTSGWFGRLLRGEHLVLYFDKGGSPPAAPPVADPNVQIQAQARANRYNIRSPFGTQTWHAPVQSTPAAPSVPAASPANSGGGRWQQTGNGDSVQNEWVPDAAQVSPSSSTSSASSADEPWTQEITLDPSQQRQFDARNQIAESMLGRAGTQLGQFSNNQFTFDPAGTGARSALDNMSQQNSSFTQAGGAFNPNVRDLGNFDPNTSSNRAAFNPTINAPGNFDPNIEKLQQFAPGELNLGAFNANIDDATSRTLVARLKGLSDTPWSAGVDGSKVSDAVYAKAKGLLDPTYGRMQGDLDQKLVNQGLPIGSEAYGEANDVFGRERSNAYNDAALNAIIQGAQEEQNQYGRALSTRQQGVNEIATGLSGAQAQASGEYGRYLSGRQQQQGEQGQQYNQALATRGQLAAEQQADYQRQLLTQQQRETGAQADYGRQADTRNIQSGDISDIFQRELAARGQQTTEQQADYGRQLTTRGQQAGEFGDDFARQQVQQQGLFTGENALDQQDQQRQLTQRQQQYNELASLLGGQQLNPLNPTGGAIDTSSAFANQQAALNRQYSGQLEGYGAGVTSNNNNISAAASVAAAYFF